jgi:hypothetical protein
MPKLTIEEAGQLGLLSPEELSAIGYNPFTPKAGASWTPQLGLRPGLNSRSFFRYPSLYQRPGISSLRFGIGGLGQGLTLSPESPALGLGGIAGPVGGGVRRGASYGVAGGVAGGRAGFGAEGSGNLPTMILPDGRRLVRLPNGRTMIVGGQRPPMQADTPDGLAELQAMGVISQGLGAAKDLAGLIGKLGSGAPGGATTTGGGPGGIPGGEPGGGLPVEMPGPVQGAPAPGGGLIQPASFELPRGAEIQAAVPDLQGIGLSPVSPLTPEVLADFQAPGTTFEMPLQKPPGGDLALSDAFYAPGGGDAASVLLDPEARRLYSLGLSPEDIMAMMPPPNATGRADTAPRGLGPTPEDIFGAEPAAAPGNGGGGFDTNFTLGSTLGLGQNLLGIGQGAIGSGITGDPTQLIAALLKSGKSINQIAQIPGLNKAGIDAGLGGALGVLNTIMAARRGDIGGAIGGGLSTLGSAAQFAASSPAISGAIGMSPGALGTVGTVAGGAGGLLSLAQGIKGLIDGGADPVQSALSMAGGLTSTYSALASLSQMYPNLGLPALPTVTQLLDMGTSALGIGGAVGGAAAGLAGGGLSAASALSATLPAATQAGIGAATTAAEALSAGGSAAAAGASGATGAASAAMAAAAPWLSVAAPIIIGIVGTLSQNEARRIRQAGYMNNPIAGNLYSNASRVMGSAKADLAKLGPLEKANTADLAAALVSGSVGLQGYLSFGMGPAGPIAASSTLTGAFGREGAAGKDGFPTIARWQKDADDMKQGLANIAKELMARGVTYEQIGSLPVPQDWGSRGTKGHGGINAEDPLPRYYAANQQKYDAEGNQIGGKLGAAATARPVTMWESRGEGGAEVETGQVNYDYHGMPMGYVNPENLFLAAQGANRYGAPDEVTKAGGLVTGMFGGPFWAMMATTGAADKDPVLSKMVHDKFDPWVYMRTMDAHQIAGALMPVVQEKTFEASVNDNESHTPGAGMSFNELAGMKPIYGPDGKYSWVSEQDIANAQNAGTVGWEPVMDPATGQMVYTWGGGPQPISQAEWQAGQAARDAAAKSAEAQKYAWMSTPPAGGAPAGSMAFDPLKFLSSLEAGERASVQSGQDTLTFVPYKPDQSQMFSAPDAGYQQIGEGFYAKPSGQGGGAEIYLPQDKASELGKALAGYQGAPPAATQVGELLTQQPVASGQEQGATPGAGPAGDIAPSPVAAGTAATTSQGTAPNPTDATAGTGTPIPGSGFKKGGVVPETGRYLVHKGEVVIPADKADTAQESDQFLEDMRQKGDLKLAPDQKPLEMPKPGPYRGSEDPTMPDEAAAVGGIRMAHHEQSETVQDDSGRWINVYGKKTPQAGQPLPYKGNSYRTVDEAVAAAKKRSADEGDRMRQDKMLEDIDSGKTAPGTLGGASREQRKYLTPEDIMRQRNRTEAPQEKGWYVHLKEGIARQDLDGTDPEVRRLAFTPDDVEQALEAGEAPIMVGKGVLSLPPSAFRGFLAKTQDMQNKDPLKHPAVIAMQARAKREAQMKPEGDTIPGTPGEIQRRQPRWPGDRPEQAVPLDSMTKEPEYRSPGNKTPGPGEIEPNYSPIMPMIPTGPDGPQPMQVRGLGQPGIGRAMRLAQGPDEDFARQDKMLEGIDTGRIAPSTLGGASREQRRNLTPQDIQNQPSRPAPTPGLLEQARRKLLG